VERTTLRTNVSYTPGAIGNVTKRTGDNGQGLEPDEGKLSCPVLRGLEGGNTFRLPGGMAATLTELQSQLRVFLGILSRDS